MKSSPLSNVDAIHLIDLCKSGRLFDVQNWIGSGKSLNVPAGFKTTPLKVALETGFHSLVEILVANEPSQDLKNRALSVALALKRLDFIELLVLHGAQISSVPFIEVLRVWEPRIIRYFLDQGADFITDFPFVVAFGEKIRTALRPWRECKEKYPQLAPQLQEQVDRALRHFCSEENLKWVSLLMWVGANPRSRGPSLDDSEEPDDEEPRTAMEAAAYAKSVKILKRLKPDAKRDEVDRLLANAATFGRSETVGYLLKLGAKPNDKANGGSSALDNCLSTSYRCESFRLTTSSIWYSRPPKASRYAVSKTRDTVQQLLERGALWRPDNASDFALVRRSLFECEPDVTLELVQLLVRHNACSQDTLHNLLRTPTMKKHLTPVATNLARVGFEVRTPEQKAEEERRKKALHEWALHNLSSRFDRERLYEEIWSEPILHVAKRYNLSDVGFAKVCRKLNIPRPGRGYWAIKTTGKPVPKRPPLPKLI